MNKMLKMQFVLRNIAKSRFLCYNDKREKFVSRKVIN